MEAVVGRMVDVVVTVQTLIGGGFTSGNIHGDSFNSSSNDSGQSVVVVHGGSFVSKVVDDGHGVGGVADGHGVGGVFDGHTVDGVVDDGGGDGSGDGSGG